MSQFQENRKKIFHERINELFDLWKKTNGKPLTHQALADFVIVHRETVTRWINGQSNPLQDEKIMEKLCDFFKVPRSFFDTKEGFTLTREDLHEDLEKSLEEYAAGIGLSIPLVLFLKESPALSDAVMNAMITDAILQSFSPDVPDTGNTFQFVSSSGTKLYPPKDVLLMLRLIQRDLTEYASFLIQKYSNVIHDAYAETFNREMRNNTFADTGEEYVNAGRRFLLDLRGRKDLTPSESLLIDAFRVCKLDEQKELMKQAAHLSHKSRKKK